MRHARATTQGPRADTAPTLTKYDAHARSPALHATRCLGGAGRRAYRARPRMSRCAGRAGVMRARRSVR
eukprot:831632-Prymnesium_polylepis.1